MLLWRYISSQKSVDLLSGAVELGADVAGQFDGQTLLGWYAGNGFFAGVRWLIDNHPDAFDEDEREDALYTCGHRKELPRETSPPI